MQLGLKHVPAALLEANGAQLHLGQIGLAFLPFGDIGPFLRFTFPSLRFTFRLLFPLNVVVEWFDRTPFQGLFRCAVVGLPRNASALYTLRKEAWAPA